MKKLLIITALSVSTLSYSACNISLDVKKAGAKTAYIDGVSVSAKIQAALSSKCTVKYNTLSKAEVSTMKLANAKNRYEKLLAASKK